MPYNGPLRPYLNANASPLYPALLQKAIVLSGLTWGLPPAQYYTMLTWFLNNPVEITTEVKEDSSLHKLLNKKNSDTLLGLPLELDKDLPSGTIQLRYQGAVLFEIQMLAVPCGFEGDSA